jgi:hypothetical protein
MLFRYCLRFLTTVHLAMPVPLTALSLQSLFSIPLATHCMLAKIFSASMLCPYPVMREGM